MRKRHGHRGKRRRRESWHHGGHLHRDCNRHFSHDHRTGQRTPEQIAEEQAAARAAHGTGVEFVDIFAGERYIT